MIKKKRVVEISAFNIHGTLGQRFGSSRRIANIPRLKLPTDIIRFQMAPSKKDTLEMVFNEGWQLSFRIDNAESLVVPSLKFDVNLVSTPSTIYSPPYSLLGRKLFFPHPTPL